MKKINLWNRFWYLVLCMCMVLAMIPGASMTPVLAATGSGAAVTSNIGDHNYSYDRWANPINSYLVENPDGTLTRVECTGDAVAVEIYDSNLQYVSGSAINMELPIFGGFYYGSDRNFLVFGQENPTEDDAVEVVRIVSYTRDWKRIGSASLYGANTSIPFDAGNLRFAEYGGYLYIRSCHEMYVSSDGRNHQSNMTINVRISDMTITDSFTGIMNLSYGYVSHSFDQYIGIDGTKIVAVDHGDANPRAVVLIRYATPAGKDSFMTDYIKVPAQGGGYYRYYTESVNVLPISGQHGANDTGVSIGGFEISDSHYLIAGTTVEHGENYDPFAQRNIFITATDKNNFSTEGTKIHAITNWTNGDNVVVSNPHLVPLGDGNYFLIWTEKTESGEMLKYCLVDGTGQMAEGTIYSHAGSLSDCTPIVYNGKITWYVTSASAPAFLTIDLENLNNVTHDHFYTYSYLRYPGYTTPGSLSCVCTVCNKAGENVVIPAIFGSDEYVIAQVSTAATCTTEGYGYYEWDKLVYYDVSQYLFGGPIPAFGHKDVDNSGRCDACECLMQPAKLCFNSISLKGNIAINYYMLLSDEVLSDSTAYMQFTMADGTIIKKRIQEAIETVYNNETYYVFTCEVDAKEMTDNVVSQFFYRGGSTKEYSFSVQGYAASIINGNYNAKTKALVEAMLHYGAASQLHFGYNTDKLANAGMDTPDYSHVTIEKFQTPANQGIEGAKFYSASLLLKSETTLRFFFTGNVTATYNGKALDVKERNGLYYVDVVGISAKNLDENVTITISDGTNTAEVTYNPMAYCAAVSSDTTGTYEQKMKDVVTALYLYNQAANTYFAK